MKYNNLTMLPTGLFKGLTNLLELDVHENQITSIGPDLLNGASKLTFLYLADNNLTDLPN